MAEPAKWQQVAGEWRQQIADGRLMPGADLGFVPALAEEFGVHPDTIRRALRALKDEGQVIPPGKGGTPWRVRVRDPMTVNLGITESRARLKQRSRYGADAWTSDVRDLGREPDQTLRIGIDKPPAEVAARLGLPPGEDAVARIHVRMIDGAPHNLSTTWYPMDLALRFPLIMRSNDIPQGVIAYMAADGIEQVRFPILIEARGATPDEAGELGILAGDPVMIEYRTGITPEGRAVKCTVTTWPGNAARLEVELEG